MSAFKLLFHPKVGKQIQGLGELDRKRIRQVLQLCSQFGLESPGIHVVKLRGVERSYRVRVGVIRIIIEVDQKKRVIYVRKIGHRREVYRDM